MCCVRATPAQPGGCAPGVLELNTFARARYAGGMGDSVSVLNRMFLAAQTSAVLTAAIELGVFAAVAGKPLTDEEVAKAIQAPTRSTRILLAALAVVMPRLFTSASIASMSAFTPSGGRSSMRGRSGLRRPRRSRRLRLGLRALAPLDDGHRRHRRTASAGVGVELRGPMTSGHG